MPPLPLDEILARLERVLRASPADATELVWLEAERAGESNGKRRRDTFELRERNILVRVRESGRVGLHHTSSSEISDLENAVRDAMAQARLSEVSPPPLLPEGADGPADLAGLYDSEVAALAPGRARELLASWSEPDEILRLGWGEARVAVANSRGLRRAARATSVWLAANGYAEAAARSLAGLDAPAVLRRARERRAGGPPAAAPAAAPALVLSPEAAARLVELLNRQALTSTSFLEGRSFLRECPQLHPALSLRDDATAAPGGKGLPFPFDLFGAARRPVDLIARGALLTPAVDDRLARALGLAPTAHRVAPDEAAAGHLFVLPGEPDGEILRRAEGGIWVSALDPLESFDTLGTRFRAAARGVRRLEGGGLGEPLPDLLWEDDLRSVFQRILGIGGGGVGEEAVSVPAGNGLFGAVTAPALALEPGGRVEKLTPRS